MSNLRMFFLGGGEPPPPFFNGTGPNFPDYELVSIDDEQVKAIALNLGAVHLFSDLPAPEAGTGRGSAIGYMVGSHATHWFFFERYQHWPKSSDNGFTLRAWPKSKTSGEEFELAVRKYAADVCIEPAQFVVRGSDEVKS